MDRKCTCNHKHHNKSSGNGFLMGVIFGVILTLLFTTKKGRELVKELTDKGLDAFSDLQKTMNEAKDDVKEVASKAIETASEIEEELVELVEDGSEGDYTGSELGEGIAASVAEDSFGSSDNEGVEESNGQKKHHEPKAAEKHGSASAKNEPKKVSNGEAKSPKRFFLRRVKS